MYQEITPNYARALESFPFTEISESESDVNSYTEFLTKRVRIDSILAPINAHNSIPARTNAIVVGAAWHLFSNCMGQFLSQAAAAMDSNVKRFALVQILWEELGEGQKQDIHADMFYNTVLAAGIAKEEMEAIRAQLAEELPLAWLRTAVTECRTDSEVLGLCAGLEAPARELIEVVYNSLAYDSGVATMLQHDTFFKLHRAIEEGHINLGTLNLVRFCAHPTQQKDYLKGFDKSVHFWKTFWQCVDRKLTNIDSKAKAG